MFIPVRSLIQRPNLKKLFVESGIFSDVSTDQLFALFDEFRTEDDILSYWFGAGMTKETPVYHLMVISELRLDDGDLWKSFYGEVRKVFSTVPDSEVFQRTEKALSAGYVDEYSAFTVASMFSKLLTAKLSVDSDLIADPVGFLRRHFTVALIAKLRSI